MTKAAWLLILGGGAMYIAAEGHFIKGVALVVGSILLDVGIDHIMLIWEKKRGEVD